MPDHPTPRDVATAIGHSEVDRAATLADRLGSATLATPGVLRLVPTLKDALGHLRSRRRDTPEMAGTRAEPASAGPDGITVAGTPREPEVTIDIAVTGQVSTLQTARAVQAAAAAVLAEDGQRAPTVRVNILEIDPVDPTTRNRP